MPTQPGGEATIAEKPAKGSKWSLVTKEEGEASALSKKTVVKSPLAGLNLVSNYEEPLSMHSTLANTPSHNRNAPSVPSAALPTSASLPPTSSSTPRTRTSTPPGTPAPKCTSSPSLLVPSPKPSPKLSPWELKALAPLPLSRLMARGSFGLR